MSTEFTDQQVPIEWKNDESLVVLPPGWEWSNRPLNKYLGFKGRLSITDVCKIAHARDHLLPVDIMGYSFSMHKTLSFLERVVVADCVTIILEYWRPLILHVTCFTNSPSPMIRSRRDYFYADDSTTAHNCYLSDETDLFHDLAAWIWMQSEGRGVSFNDVHKVVLDTVTTITLLGPGEKADRTLSRVEIHATRAHACDLYISNWILMVFRAIKDQIFPQKIRITPSLE